MRTRSDLTADVSPPAPPPGGKRNIRARSGGFILAFMIILTAALSLAAHILPEPMARRVLRDETVAISQIWQRRILSQVAGGAEAFERGTLDPATASRLGTVPWVSDLYRLKFFDADGNVFWSTRSSDVGNRIVNEAVRGALARGQPFYQAGIRHASEIDHVELHAGAENSNDPMRRTAAIYEPVVADGQVVGAIKFHSDITGRHATLVARLSGILWVAAAVLAGTVGIAAAIVHKFNTRQVRMMADRRREEMISTQKELGLARNIRVLGEFNEWLQSSRSLDELFAMIADYMTHLMPEVAGSLYVYSNSRDVLDAAIGWNGSKPRDHIRPEDCWGLRRGRTYAYGTAEVNFACEHTKPHDDRPYYCFPILAHGETVGLLHLRSLQGVQTDGFRQLRKSGQMCAEQISMAIANVRMRDELHHRAVRDPLTGLYNRRHLTDVLRKGLARVRDGEAELALISLDVDHFKRFNDTHGHDAGDMVLRSVSEALAAACDGDEIAARAGGEEFMLVWPDVAPADALARAEALRRRIGKITVRYGDKALPRVTVSIGLAQAPRDGSLPQDLMRAADVALYASKDAGRDRVTVAETLRHDEERAEEARDEAAQIGAAPAGEVRAAEVRIEDGAEVAGPAGPDTAAEGAATTARMHPASATPPRLTVQSSGEADGPGSGDGDAAKAADAPVARRSGKSRTRPAA
ncbi:MAG: sensor domain-containing diguanylate cyclase [Paracoccaceae bacterium]